MYSNISIVRSSHRVSKSLAPANKRKTHRTIVVVPQKRFLRIPPDNQDVNHVRIMNPRPEASRDVRQPTTPKLIKSVYPYGTSLIRKCSRDVKQHKRLIVFNTAPPAPHNHTPARPRKRMEDMDDILDTFQREMYLASSNYDGDGTIEDINIQIDTGYPHDDDEETTSCPGPVSPLSPSPSTSEEPIIPTIDLTDHRVLLESNDRPADLHHSPYFLPTDFRFAPSCVIKYRYIFEELSRVSRLYDSTAIQIQVSAACGNAFQNLKTTLLKLHNITVLAGPQIITQTVPHTPQSIAAFKYCHANSHNVLDTVRSVFPRAVSYHETGVHQLYVSGATKKDLFDAATLCAAVAEKQPDIFNINICALSYPSIAAPHLPLYNSFTEFHPQV
ncbi:protein UL117 [Mandrillus leucophaeus cytomegalovirus]|uniref:Protein UL117 n=1 Tax=Mandrillus leucophaeus cytomegalovirus TaxID=1654930 RepID=A0A0G2UGH4_9BETA|nr:protein UL117 [Mandrillus leucophaeus cytomegalovirus]AKI29745.1 protein UL117 [Mandrillus leucophaeus cytomegalovirus]